ncbi:hypothetical protein ACFYXP_36315, partial [Streptomyces sp. NPDC002466]
MDATRYGEKAGADAGDGVWRVGQVVDGRYEVARVHEGRCLREVAAPVTPKEGSVELGISGDGRYAITAGLYTVRFCDLAEGRCLRVFDAV